MKQYVFYTSFESRAVVRKIGNKYTSKSIFHVTHSILSYLDKSNFRKVDSPFYDEQSCEHQHLLGISRGWSNIGSSSRISVRRPETRKTSGFGKNRVRSFIKVTTKGSTISRLSHEACFLARRYLARVRKKNRAHREHDVVVKLERCILHPLSLIQFPSSALFCIPPSSFSACVRPSNFRRFQWGLSMLAR